MIPPSLLVEDILAAGAGASLPEAAQILAEEGPVLLKEVLIDKAGIQFDHEPDGALSLRAGSRPFAAGASSTLATARARPSARA